MCIGSYISFETERAVKTATHNKFRDYIDSLACDVFGDAQDFTEAYNKATGKEAERRLVRSINREFITKMVQDELKELAYAKDIVEEVDALIDIMYYCAQHLSSRNIDGRPIWKLVHSANMTKFGPTGYLGDDGKWNKPEDFVPPDEDIRKEIERQSQTFYSVF